MQISVSNNVKYFLVGEGSKSAIAVIDDTCDDVLLGACFEQITNKCKQVSKDDAVKLLKAGVALFFTPAAFVLLIAES